MRVLTLRPWIDIRHVVWRFIFQLRQGLDVAIAALREYLRTHKKGIDDLTRAAKADQVYTVMRPYIEALV